MRVLITLLFALLVAFPLAAQEATTSKATTVDVAQGERLQGEPAMYPNAQGQAPANLKNQASAPKYQRVWSAIEIVLSVAILVFALLVIAIQAFVARKATKAWSPHSITRATGLTMILSFAMVLIVAGYDKDQIAPVMGLLGVIAGYLLGNGDRSKSISNE